MLELVSLCLFLTEPVLEARLLSKLDLLNWIVIYFVYFPWGYAQYQVEPV